MIVYENKIFILESSDERYEGYFIKFSKMRAIKMQDVLQTVEKELNIPKERLIEKGVMRFLEVELRNVSLEIKKLEQRYGVDSFDGLWEKLERGKVKESECFDDLTRFEYLETEKDKIRKLLHLFEKQ